MICRWKPPHSVSSVGQTKMPKIWPASGRPLHHPGNDDDDDDDDHDDGDDDDGDARSVKELAGSARHTNRLFPPTPLPTLYTSYECTSYTAVRLHVYLDFVKSIEQKL